VQPSFTPFCLSQNAIYNIYKKKERVKMSEDQSRPTRAELIAMLDELVAGFENMPAHALVMPVTHYDHWQLMILLAQILKAEK
jgi:hypothetical protein